MGASKKLHEEEQEFLSIEMNMSFYEENEALLKVPEVRIKSAYAKRSGYKSDDIWQSKLDALIHAKNELLEYEVEMNYKRMIDKK